MPTVNNIDEENPCKKDADKRQSAFDRKLHGQSDEELIDRVDSWVRQLCETGGSAWTLSIPPNPTRDPDLLISELIRRFKGQRDAVDRLVNAEADQKKQIQVARLGEDGEIIITPIDVINEQQASHIAELTERYESVKKERDELRIKISNMEAAVKELREMLEDVEKRKAEQNGRLESLIVLCEEQTKLLVDYKIREQFLNEAFESLKREHRNLCKSPNADLQNRVEVLEEELRLMDEAFTREKMEHRKAREKLGNKSLIQSKLSATIDQMRKEIADLQNENTSYSNTCEAQRAEIEINSHVIRESDATIGSLKRAIEIAGTEEQRKIAAIEEKNVDLRHENERSRRHIDELNAKTKELNRKLYEVNNYVDTIADLRLTMGLQVKTIAELRAENDRLSETEDYQIQQLRAALDEQRATIEDLKLSLAEESDATKYQTKLKVEAIRREQELKDQFSAQRLNTRALFVEIMRIEDLSDYLTKRVKDHILEIEKALNK